MHFGIPRSVILNKDTRFLNAFWNTLWEKMDTKLKKSISFYPQIDKQTTIVNETMVKTLRGYN